VAQKHVLGDDLPKQNPWQEDRLNYAPFAKRIARVITGLVAPNGYVIGLHGQWGSGKSTIINFILANIYKHNVENDDDQVVHIDFRPWIVSGHQDLIVAFFKILSENLGPRRSGWERLWQRALSFLRGTTDNLVDAAAKVALSVDPTGIAGGFGANLAKKSVNTLLDRFVEEPSLQAAYENLKEQLGRSGKRFLVTIDDIDRLEDEHVRSIMQMVKSIGRLPNITYLLSYDREIVWEALDQGKTRAGPRFAEKIVQQEIDLPKPSPNALLSILDQEISFLTAKTPNSTRWQYIVRDGIRRWIRSPRDVVRLSNAVKFTWPALEDEIDPQDLLAMEGLRLFDAGAFAWVRDNRDFLFSDGRFVMADDQAKEEAVEGLKRRIAQERQSQVLRVLAVLFPQAGKWFEGREAFGGEASLEVARRRGVGSEAGYDTYFGLHPSADAIPKVVINDLMSRLESTQEIERIMRGYLGQRNSRGELMIGKLLDELRIQYRTSQPAQPTQALLDALFRVGEEVISIDWDGDMFHLSPRAQISFLVRSMLEQWGIEHAGQRLIEAFQKSNSVAFMAEEFVERGRELGVFRADSSERAAISQEAFDKLGQILLAKIKKGETDGTLANAPFFFNIVRAWSHVAGPNAPRNWLTDGIKKDADFMARASRGLVSYSLGGAERHYNMRDMPDINLYDLKALVEAGEKHLEKDDLPAEQRKIIIEVVRGARQFGQAGSPNR
jgi:predicted KAP-like P-loop ATPase